MINCLEDLIVVLAGDFRQMLPMIPRSTPVDELNACLKSSYLWKKLQIRVTVPQSIA